MTRTKINQVVFGAALAESLTASSLYHRRDQVRANLGEKIRQHMQFAESKKQTNIVSAFSLPKDSKTLKPLPSDDLEWFAFSALAALSTDSIEYWYQLLPKLDEVSARTGTKIALKNLLLGNKDFAGYDNPQYFDDISMIRAIAIALVHRDSPANFAQALRADISLTHALDGLWAGTAVGELAWQLLNGASRNEAISKAISSIPSETWLGNSVQQGLSATEGVSGLFERVLILEDKVIDRVSSHPNTAPETSACLFAHAMQSHSSAEFLMASFLHPRLSDSLPALHGALATLLFNDEWVPNSYIQENSALVGCAIKDLAGLRLGTLAEEIYAAV